MTAVEQILLGTAQAIAAGKTADPQKYAMEVLRGLHTRTVDSDSCPTCETTKNVILLEDDGHSRRLVCTHCGGERRVFHEDPDCE